MWLKVLVSKVMNMGVVSVKRMILCVVRCW